MAKGADLRQDPLTIALRTALVLSVAWLITSMYTLSWYDLIAWVPLAVLAASKLDRIMLMRIAPLSLAYVPGRAIDVGPVLDFTATRMRDTISPIVQFAVLLAVVLWWRQPDRQELFPFRRHSSGLRGELVSVVETESVTQTGRRHRAQIAHPSTNRRQGHRKPSGHHLPRRAGGQRPSAAHRRDGADHRESGQCAPRPSPAPDSTGRAPAGSATPRLRTAPR